METLLAADKNWRSIMNDLEVVVEVHVQVSRMEVTKDDKLVVGNLSGAGVGGSKYLESCLCRQPDVMCFECPLVQV